MEADLKNELIEYFKKQNIEITDATPKIIDLIINNGSKVLIELKCKNAQPINSTMLIQAYGQLLTAKQFYNINDLWLVVNDMPSFRHYSIFQENNIRVFEFKNNELKEIQIIDLERKLVTTRPLKVRPEVHGITLRLSPEEETMIAFLEEQKHLKTKTKVLKFCLKQTHDTLKYLWGDN